MIEMQTSQRSCGPNICGLGFVASTCVLRFRCQRHPIKMENRMTITITVASASIFVEIRLWPVSSATLLDATSLIAMANVGVSD